ncbi:unnamed protein product, partial [marine sediment metagenome]
QDNNTEAPVRDHIMNSFDSYVQNFCYKTKKGYRSTPQNE